MDPLDHASSCHLLCPQERYDKEKDLVTVKTVIGVIYQYHIIKNSYFISVLEDEKSNHLHSLLCRNAKEGEKVNFRCEACPIRIEDKTYYFCSYCNGYYHKKCVESLSVFRYSCHPKHPLQLVWYSKDTTGQCFYCSYFVSGLVYYCSICNFSLHPACASKPTSLTIDNPKRHEHTLHYFPRDSTLVCDVCALVDDFERFYPTLYVCLQCDFIVHKRCVYLPYVIKVSRHHHRLTFTANLPYKEGVDCGVCHVKINENYGEYSCTKGCVYAVHSGCAMQTDVCDGKELEGEPEDTTYVNTKMYEEVDDGIIQHLSHPHHHMRLDKMVQGVCVYEENKYCQACRHPCYDDGNVYQCMQCDFILHESCAYIPRVKQFMLYVYPLILDSGDTTSWFICRACGRYSCGFAYVSPIRGVDFKLDILCSSISEPFDYHSHPHPLLITSGGKNVSSVNHQQANL